MKMDYLTRRMLLATCLIGCIISIATGVSPLITVLYSVVGITLCHVEELE